MRKYTYMEIWNCKKPTLFSLLVNTSFGNLRLTSFQSSRSGKDECLPPSILPANQDGALGTWDHPSTILSRRMGYEDTPVSVQLWHGMDRQFLKENKTGGHSKMTAIYCTFTPALPLSLLDHKAHHDYPGQAASLLFLDHIMFVTDWKTKPLLKLFISTRKLLLFLPSLLHIIHYSDSIQADLPHEEFPTSPDTPLSWFSKFLQPHLQRVTMVPSPRFPNSFPAVVNGIIDHQTSLPTPAMEEAQPLISLALALAKWLALANRMWTDVAYTKFKHVCLEAL